MENWTEEVKRKSGIKEKFSRDTIKIFGERINVVLLSNGMNMAIEVTDIIMGGK